MIFNFRQAIGFWVNRTAFVMRRELHRRFRLHEQDITPEEWALLVQLWDSDGQSAGELADKTIRDRTTVTRLLDGIERKGLIRRGTDRADRRLVRILLTAKGRDSEQQLVPIVSTLLKDSTRGISKQDIQITLDTLRRMQHNLLQLEQARDPYEP